MGKTAKFNIAMAVIVTLVIIFYALAEAFGPTPVEPPLSVSKTVAGRMTEPSWRGMRWYVVAEDGTFAEVPAAKWRMAKKGSSISSDKWKEQ